MPYIFLIMIPFLFKIVPKFLHPNLKYYELNRFAFWFGLVRVDLRKAIEKIGNILEHSLFKV